MKVKAANFLQQAPWMLVGLGLAPSLTAGLTSAEAAARVGMDPAPVVFLEHLCDDFGARLTGSTANEGALGELERALRELGLEPERETFSMPGWVRENDELHMVTPVPRQMRAIGIGYTAPAGPRQGPVVDLGQGEEERFAAVTGPGSVGLLGPASRGRADELAARAARHGLGALMLINRKGGGQLLARTGGFHGDPLPLPVYSVTQEEGYWMRRRLARGEPVTVRLQSRSFLAPVESSNLRVRFPGRSEERILVGAHFDSWDQGQGAIDNGLGIAQLYALARLLSDQQLERTVELVWFNGEEQGLWGSRHAISRGRDAAQPPAVVLNLDMTGVPIAVNAMGHDDLVPLLRRWNEERGEAALPEGVENLTWAASDHTPYQIEGVRVLTFNAPIPRESVRYYHDFGDTYDKLTAAIIQDSSATIASLVVNLANAPDLPVGRVSAEQTKALLRRAQLESKLQTVGLWNF